MSRNRECSDGASRDGGSDGSSGDVVFLVSGAGGFAEYGSEKGREGTSRIPGSSGTHGVDRTELSWLCCPRSSETDVDTIVRVTHVDVEYSEGEVSEERAYGEETDLHHPAFQRAVDLRRSLYPWIPARRWRHHYDLGGLEVPGKRSVCRVAEKRQPRAASIDDI